MRKRISASFMAFLLMSLCGFHVHAASIPLITEAQKEKSIKTIMDSGEVINATISQEGRVVSLAIIADAGILGMDAVSLARSFVRAVKIFSPDIYQGEEDLGIGIYDYRVTVRDAGEKGLLAAGEKPADQSNIVWTLPASGEGD